MWIASEPRMWGQAAAFGRPMSAASGATTAPDATDAVATIGSSLSFKSVFQPARSGGLAHASRTGDCRAKSDARGRLRRNRGDRPRAGARFLAGDAVRQRPGSPWPAPLTVWQSTYFRSVSPLEAPFAAPR